MEQLFEEEKILICACHNSEHQILIHKDIIDGEVYMDIHLAKRSFLERLTEKVFAKSGLPCREFQRKTAPQQNAFSDF